MQSKNKHFKSKSIRSCEIVSQLYDTDGNEIFDLDNMKLQLKNPRIKDYAYIIHDRDTYSSEDENDEDTDKVEGTLKPAHIHLYIRFVSPRKLASIAGWFKIAENFIQHIHNWNSAIRYLIHLDHPDKFQYSVEDVTANFDMNYILQVKDEKKYLDQVLLSILNGEIKEYNKTHKINQLVLAKHRTKIEDAFKTRQNHCESLFKDRSIDVIFIHGHSGSGKTTLAKHIAREKHMAFCLSSSSNDPLQDYKQEECLILDDMRGSTMALSDLLKLLDNHTVSTVKSRYKNKFLQCELIIITSVKDIEEFYSTVFQNEEEPILQFKRRCSTVITLDYDRLYIKVWDETKRAYSKTEEYENPLHKILTEKQRTSGTLSTETVHKKYLPFCSKIPDDERKHGFNTINPTDESIIPFL